eukprot:6227753-Amphidinium_carterae.1
MRVIKFLAVQVDFAVDLAAMIISTVSFSTPTSRTTSSTTPRSLTTSSSASTPCTSIAPALAEACLSTHNTTTTDDIIDKFHHNITTTSPTGARNKTDGYKDRHKDCRKEGDAHKKDAEETCDELEKAQMGVHAPLLDFELGIDMSDEETL